MLDVAGTVHTPSEALEAETSAARAVRGRSRMPQEAQGRAAVRACLRGGWGRGRRSRESERGGPAAGDGGATTTATCDPAGPRSRAATSSLVSREPSTW